DRLLRHPIEPVGWISESFGELPTHLKVEGAAGRVGHGAIHDLDLVPEFVDVDVLIHGHLAYTATVTRRKVAGIAVVPGWSAVFCALNRASSSLKSSSSRPFDLAASNAFIVGP